MDDARSGSDGFVWPPQRLEVAETGGERARPDRDGNARGPRVGWFASAMHVWCGPATRVFGAQRHEDAAAWVPDEPALVCWRCGGATGAHEADGDGCAACRGRRLAWSRFVRLGSYEGELRRSLLELKFSRWHKQGVVVGRALGERVAAELDRLGMERERVVYVPVPMPWSRRVARGIDHAHVLAVEAARVAGGRVTRVLRARGGAMQVEVPASRRGTNVRRRFVRRRMVPEGCIVVVVDDIRTTGATLTAACRAVRGIGRGRQKGDVDIGRVWTASAAVTPARDRAVGG